MNGQVVKRVVVAGGGSAGWMAAAALSRQLGPLLEIILVESDEIGTVGVGESTVPTARTFNALLKLDEREFMSATQATFKLGISFENWGEIGDRYIHSFGQVGKSTWLGHFHHMWLAAKAQGFGGDLGDYCLELKAAEQHRFYTDDNASLNYAYHIDATLYGRYLRQKCEDKGVRRVEGKIVEVRQRSDNGFIEALVLESGEVVEGDLFIDCTGFRGLLINGALGIGFEDWGRWLPNDRAWAVQTSTTVEPGPYTRAIAHKAGWLWGIPLQQRVGNGLVFSSEYMTDEEGLQQLENMIEGEMLIEPKLIRFRAGRRHKAWHKNCVSLGLAAGFIEPLESTSIHMIMIAVHRLLQLFPFQGCNDALSDRFNNLADDEILKIRDFIVLHYNVTERTDSPYWNHVRTMEIPDTLAHRLALFRDSGQVFQAPGELFQVDSWLQVMLGQRLEPRAYHHMGHLMPPEQLRGALTDLKGNIARAVERMPSHQAFINRYCPIAA
ncbi:tryptophan halogenase family protein [Caulobacter sp. NIBR2454]|uniref:tryptophan halogenase family protein n=1 Tax=Caulobacter sp. NIBR2454 TaxID=3015996 RepID=UPI0022B6D677|nr:tryptophan halogenase family protein [Caulobacter sp. NIBR2454]